jgi:DNA-binding transcriptional MerR regulator
MSERIFTLFGEEIVPEPAKPTTKPRAKKAAKEKNTESEETHKEPGKENAPLQDPASEPNNEEPGKADNVDPVNEVVVTNTVQETVAQRESEDEPEKAEEPDIITSQEEPDEALEKVSKKTKKEYVNLHEDWEGDKQYYSIGEVATLFNVKTSHIRFWTNEFKLKVRTNRKGDRLYTPEQIKEIRAIHHLVKERGFTLSGAKAKLKTQNKRDVETIDLKKSLEQLRSKLVIIKTQLK